MLKIIFKVVSCLVMLLLLIFTIAYIPGIKKIVLSILFFMYIIVVGLTKL